MNIVKANAENIAQLMAMELRPFRQFKDDETAFGALKNFFATPLLARAEQTGRVCALFEKGQCRAVVLQSHNEPSHVGYKVESLDIHFCPDDRLAINWVEETLLDLSLTQNLRQILTLSGCHVQLLPTLERIGIGVDAVGLIADTDSSLNNLVEVKNPSEDFKKADLSYAPMAQEHIEAVVALRKRTFVAHPEYCWFGAGETHLAGYRKRMSEAIAREHLWWVLLEGERVVGNFGNPLATI